MNILSQYETIGLYNKGHHGWDSNHPLVPISKRTGDLCDWDEPILEDEFGFQKFIDFGATFYAELLIEGFEGAEVQQISDSRTSTDPLHI